MRTISQLGAQTRTKENSFYVCVCPLATTGDLVGKQNKCLEGGLCAHHEPGGDTHTHKHQGEHILFCVRRPAQLTIWSECCLHNLRFGRKTHFIFAFAGLHN